MLLLGQVLRVLPEGVKTVLDAGGSGGGAARWSVDGRPTAAAAGIVVPGGFADIIPRGSADVIDGFGGLFHDMERVGAANSVGRAFLDHTGDPCRGDRGNMRDLCSTLRP